MGKVVVLNVRGIALDFRFGISDSLLQIVQFGLETVVSFIVFCISDNGIVGGDASREVAVFHSTYGHDVFALLLCRSTADGIALSRYHEFARLHFRHHDRLLLIVIDQFGGLERGAGEGCLGNDHGNGVVLSGLVGGLVVACHHFIIDRIAAGILTRRDGFGVVLAIERIDHRSGSAGRTGFHQGLLLCIVRQGLGSRCFHQSRHGIHVERDAFYLERVGRCGGARDVPQLYHSVSHERLAGRQLDVEQSA